MKLFNLAFWTVFAVLVAFSARPVQAAEAAKKPAPTKKEVKHHKKFDGEKIPTPEPKSKPTKKK